MSHADVPTPDSGPGPSDTGRSNGVPGDRHLADAARRVIRAVRSTRVDDDRRARATALLAEAAACLEEDATSGPYWHTGLEVIEDFEFSTDFAAAFPFSPAIGPMNPVAPPAVLELGEDGAVSGSVTFTEQYGGPPFDAAHGGVIASVYDELLAIAAYAVGGGGMTGRLTIRYRRPTPLFTPIRLRAVPQRSEERRFVVRGDMRAGDELLSEAEGLFIRPRRARGEVWAD